MNILALDIATKTGWAMSVDGAITSGVRDYTEYYKNDWGEMAWTFDAWLHNTLEQGKIELLVAERPMGRSAHVDHIKGMLWQAHAAAYALQIHRGEFIATQWRKDILGHSPPNSKQAKAEVYDWARTMGFDPADDNEADALGMLHCAMGQSKLTKTQAAGMQ